MLFLFVSFSSLLFVLVIIAMMSLCAGRKPLREVTQLLRRMFLSTPAPVTTWAGESTFGDREVIIDVAKVR